MFGGGMFSKFGGYSAICQTKMIQINSYSHSVTINNTWPVNLFTKVSSNFYPSAFAKQYRHQTFPLYGN